MLHELGFTKIEFICKIDIKIHKNIFCKLNSSTSKHTGTVMALVFEVGHTNQLVVCVAYHQMETLWCSLYRIDCSCSGVIRNRKLTTSTGEIFETTIACANYAASKLVTYKVHLKLTRKSILKKQRTALAERGRRRLRGEAEGEERDCMHTFPFPFLSLFLRKLLGHVASVPIVQRSRPLHTGMLLVNRGHAFVHLVIHRNLTELSCITI